MSGQGGSSAPSEPLLFSSGLEAATMVVASSVLDDAWTATSDLLRNFNQSTPDASMKVRFEEFDRTKYRIIAFATSTQVTEEYLRQGKDLVSCAADFRFLRSIDFSDFSIIGVAKSLLDSVRKELLVLIEKIKGSSGKPFLITGRGLGGSVASLFTLMLLDSLDPTKSKRPLCITFGSLLIGDASFKGAISQYPAWCSCFLNVVHKDDPLPRVLLPGNYCPFGTYMFCSESGCACFSIPEEVEYVLRKMEELADGDRVLSEFQYDRVIEHLQRKVGYVDSRIGIRYRHPDLYLIGINAQLAAIELPQIQGVRSTVWEKFAAHESERKEQAQAMEPAKQLNKSKVNMAQLECYKKLKSQEKGYYDCYKSNRGTSDMDVNNYMGTLNDYWRKEVTSAEKRPQKEDAHLRERWLLAGNNYRKMVEPLDIAAYYNKRNKSYLTSANGRSDVYKKLEKWQKEAEDKEAAEGETKTKTEEGTKGAKKRQEMIASNMTVDSCFWAHVEEAMIACELIKDKKEVDESISNLIKFDVYVVDLIDNYAVSPEIFLPESTYMKWWKLYELILKDNLMGAGHDSKLVRFMEEARYRKDKDGMYTPCY